MVREIEYEDGVKSLIEIFKCNLKSFWHIMKKISEQKTVRDEE